ncbi:MAG: hypothetical protein RJA57_1997 [Bacteroidota bacterium]|jgi:hypothetical protein
MVQRILAKKLLLAFVVIVPVLTAVGQDTTLRRSNKDLRKEERRQKISELVRQAEEGVLVYNRQSLFGLQFRTNGYGAYYELGRMKTNRRTTIYRVDFTEIKHQKEDKQPNAGFLFGNPFIYGKQNYFYQLTLGFGQQLILGQKGNKNGVALSAVYNGGLALGLLRPYYIEVQDPMVPGQMKVIKYAAADSALFLGTDILGGAGFSKGWNEVKMKPGIFAKAALRFDYGRYNEVVSGLEIGVSGEFYASKIPILVGQKERQFFFQGYIALCFGRRK